MKYDASPSPNPNPAVLRQTNQPRSALKKLSFLFVLAILAASPFALAQAAYPQFEARDDSRLPAVSGRGKLLLNAAVTASGSGSERQTAVEDSIDYLDNGVIRIGVNLNLGGSITYLADAKMKENIVNSWDWGRQIQQSYYSGPVPYQNPAPDWKGLGWNPIQSGDFYRNRSKILAHTNNGKILYVKTVPMHWPLNNVPGECTMETWIELDASAAKISCRLNNARPDKTFYGARSQELPAIYTIGTLWKLMTYTGADPFSNGEIERIKKVRDGAPFPWEGFRATENWAALVNDKDWGLGVFTPGTAAYIGGFNGKENNGGVKDDPCGYIAPIHNEILDHNIVYDYSYTLVLGSLSDIRAYALQHKPDGRPDFRFAKDRQHWTLVHTTDAGFPIKEKWHVLLEKNDPQLIGPPGVWKAADAPKLFVRASGRSKKTTAQIYWKRFGDKDFSVKQCMDFELIADGAPHTYEIHLAASPEYNGTITQLRFDPVTDGVAGEFIDVEYIGWKKPE